MELHGMPGHLLRRLHQASCAIFDIEAGKHGCHPTPVQFAALSVIDAHPGLDQATLAAAIAYDRVTIGGVVDRLEQKGFVRREIANDRRARSLFILPAGKAQLDGITPVVREVQIPMLNGLSKQDGTQLLRLLRKALGAVGDTSRATGRSGSKV